MSINDILFGTGQAGYQGNGTKILVADDDPIQRENIVARLEIAGYQVREAVSGEEALNMLAQENFDAVVMDTDMAGISGYEACSVAREYPMGKRLAILGISGFLHNQSFWKEAGADDFIYKPDIGLTPHLLEQKIYSAVTYRRSQF